MQHDLTPNDNALIELLGKNASSPEVAAFAAQFGPLDRQESRPRRFYLGSRDNSIDLLFQDDAVIAVQVQVVGNREAGAFAGELPFGLLRGMTPEQVHANLGEPVASDEFDSRYRLHPGASLIVEYTYGEPAKVVKCLHISTREIK